MERGMNTCKIDGCDRRVTARGWCRMHYLQQWRAGSHTEAPVRAGTVVVCPADHPHDVDGCWAEHGCRCTRCQHLRKMDRQRRRNRLRAYGRADDITPPRVPAAPVFKHVVELQADGFGLERIADAAGVSRSVVLDVIYGRRGKNRRADAPVPTIRESYALRILALTPSDIEAAIVPSTGTVRRLQALCAIGFAETDLAALMSMRPGNFSPVILGYRPRITAATAARASEIFTDLWERPPSDRRAENTRKHAKARGWVGPLAWDDIDDPNEQPEGVAERKTRTPAEDLLDDITFLLELGESPEQVAVVVDRQVGSIAKLAERNGRRDLAQTFGAIGKRVAA
jgi:hypothetical protein